MPTQRTRKRLITCLGKCFASTAMERFRLIILFTTRRQARTGPSGPSGCGIPSHFRFNREPVGSSSMMLEQEAGKKLMTSHRFLHLQDFQIHAITDGRLPKDQACVPRISVRSLLIPIAAAHLTD